MTSTPKTLSQPREYWAAWLSAADDAGLSLSAWIAQQCNATLPKQVQDKLPDRPPAHRPRSTQ